MRRFWIYYLGCACASFAHIYAAQISMVGNNTWLVDAGEDILVAHAVLTSPPYNADPSGVNDSTHAFEKAIDAVGKMGGGLIYVPAGKYNVQGTIQLNQDKVVIQGEVSRESAAKSTILLAHHGKGDEQKSPFITITGSSCGLRNLAVFYPEQGRSGFVPFPCTIQSSPSVLLENLTLYNAYKGIHFDMMNGVLLENIRMCALKNGLTGKLSSEFGWSRNIEISADVWMNLPGFLYAKEPSRDAVLSYMKENCTGMELGALDGFVVDGLVARDCRTALWITKDQNFIREFRNGSEVQRLNDTFGFGGILSRIEGRIAYTGHDFYYWGIPAINLDNVRGLPELGRSWPTHRRAGKYSVNDFFNVVDSGAVGDGKTDDTPAVLETLDKAAANGGGIVYFPQGKYRIRAPLKIPPGTELRGACARQEVRLGDAEVTSILFEEGTNALDVTTATACITLAENSGIRGLNILFPEQWDHMTKEAFKPVPYPYAVQGRGKGVYLIDCVITPAWQMIDFASYPCDNFMIKRVAGWGIQKGINIGGGTRGGTIEFTQLTFGLALNTLNNPLMDMKDGLKLSRDILSDYSGSNSVPYLFGDCSDVVCYGLQAFHPLKHVVMYKQNSPGKSLGPRNARFYYPLLDVSLEQSLVMDGARNIDFYGYWVTGRNRELNWIKAADVENIRIYAPGIQPTYHRGNYEESVPLNEFRIIPETPRLSGVGIIHGDPDAVNTLDGDLETYWQSPLNKADFVVDLGKVMKVHRYTLVDGHMMSFDESTAIKRYRISVSHNDKDWMPLEILDTNFQNYQYNNPRKFVILDQPVTPVEARYVRLEILDLWAPPGVTGDREESKNTRSATVRMFNIWADPI